MPGGLPETRVEVSKSTGELLTPTDAIVQAEYAYTDGSVALDGEPIARDEALGLTLYLVDGPLVSTTSVTGVYNDQWSGPEVIYRRVRCQGGTLTVTLDSDPGLFDAPQSVTVTAGARTATVRVTPQGSTEHSVPLTPRNGVCTVRFAVFPTRVPGNGDDRELGVHFRAFDYEAP
jgi:hypothetical protein